MGVKLNFEAVNELPSPLQPGTIYYVNHGDGTATQVVTDATGQITGRQVVGLMTSGSLGRTGAVTNRLTRTGSNFMQHFTNTSGTPILLTGLSIEGVTGPGSTGELVVAHAVTRVILARGDATLSNGVLRTTFTAPYTWAPGAELAFGWYNNDTDGSGNPISTPLTFSLSSGHTWAGITLSNTNLWTSFFALSGQVGEDNGAPTAQLRFQFGTGGQVVRRVEAGQGLSGDVTAGVLTLALREGAESGRWEGRWWGNLATPDQINESGPPIRRTQAVYLDYENESVAGSRAAFNAVFTGFVTPRYNEAYTLHYASDDGIRVYLDGVLVVDHWVSGVIGDDSVTLSALDAGRTYAMRVEWFQIANSQANRLRLEWSSPSQERELIRPAAGAAPPVSSVAGRTGVVTLTSADLADFTEAAQDATASMISDSTDVDAVYADGSSTLAMRVTGIQNKAVPAGGTGGQSIRLTPNANAWEFYDPAAGNDPGGGETLPAPGTAGNVLTSDGAEWVSAPAPGTGGGYQLTRTATGTNGPLNLIADPIADGRVNELLSGTGFDSGLSYVGAVPSLRHGPLATGSIWAWAEQTRAGAFTFELTMNMTADTYGQRHAGLFVQTADGTAATGYRIVNHGGAWSVNRYLDGANQGAVGNSVSGPTFVLGAPRRLKLTVTSAGLMTLFVDDLQVGQWADSANWVSGRPGAFAFQSTVDYTAATFAAAGMITVNGLTGGQVLRASNGTSGGPTLALPGVTRVDACAQDGGVLASAWMSPGETWLLT